VQSRSLLAIVTRISFAAKHLQFDFSSFFSLPGARKGQHCKNQPSQDTAATARASLPENSSAGNSAQKALRRRFFTRTGIKCLDDVFLELGQPCKQLLAVVQRFHAKLKVFRNAFLNMTNIPSGCLLVQDGCWELQVFLMRQVGVSTLVFCQS
jgi:hypothetical protein